MDVYVGVKDGNQKSGSLCFRASACSRSISRRAASSASWARISIVEVSNSNLRFVPRASRGGQYSVIPGVMQMNVGSTHVRPHSQMIWLQALWRLKFRQASAGPFRNLTVPVPGQRLWLLPFPVRPPA